ncbi:MAG: MFS transporter [Lysobacterales bacterium]|nr:MAG: MFS transporter [Xanthomonadales bacterium]
MVKSGSSASGDWHQRTVIAAGMTSGLGDFCYETARAVLPGFSAALGVPAAVLGLIEGLAEAMASLMKSLAGWIAERLGTRKGLVVLGYALTPIGQALMALALAWPLLLLGRVLSWLGKGLRGPLRDAIIAQAVASGARGRAFGLHRSLDTLGAVLGPLAAVGLLEWARHWLDADPVGPFRLVLWLSLIPGVLAVLIFARFVRDEGIKPNPRFRLRETFSAWPPSFRRYLGAVFLFGLGDVSPVLIILAATAVLTPELGALAAAQFGALLYGLRNLVQVVASWPAGWLADRLGHLPILLAGYGLGLMGMILLASAFLAEASSVLLVAAFLVVGLSAAVQEALESTVAAELSGLDGIALKLGVLGSANGLSRLLGNTLVGFLWTALSPFAGLMAAATTMMLGGLLLAAVPRR